MIEIASKNEETCDIMDIQNCRLGKVTRSLYSRHVKFWGDEYPQVV